MVFTETSLDVEVNLPSEGYPLQKNVVEIKVTDRFLNQPASVYGILEVFDNRVASKSPREPLVSALGDSYRNLSNYLVSWRDWTGIDKEEKEGAGLFDQITSLVLGEGSAPKAMMAAPQPSLMGGGETQVSGEYVPQETIREGEKKVVYCGVFHTGADGKAKITVQLPHKLAVARLELLSLIVLTIRKALKSSMFRKRIMLRLIFPAWLCQEQSSIPGFRWSILAQKTWS